jgi:5'-3' exonuclease
MSTPKSKEVKFAIHMMQNSFYSTMMEKPSFEQMIVPKDGSKNEFAEILKESLQNRAYHNFSLKNVEEITITGREHLAKLKKQMEPIKFKK